MAVEILERDLGVTIRELKGSDIAYDVHVRRVLLRIGLAERDDLDHMLEVTRAANPERPGAIDFPAWRIGRAWCQPGIPDCPPVHWKRSIRSSSIGRRLSGARDPGVRRSRS